MSDNEYERFEISDYDLANEFNINRPRRRQTKHQQIYGIWADDSDNDSAEESSKRRGRRGRGSLGSSSKPKDYTAPVSFVAGGVQQAGKKKKQDKDDKTNEGAKTDDDADENDDADDDDDDNDDEEAEENSRPAFGRKKLRQTASPQHSSDEGSSSAEEEKFRARPTSSNVSHRTGFGTQKHTFDRGGPGGKNMGAWQQHTRGIGAKLLLQMGYKPGMGLGKDLQGISQPVEAHVRKGRGAIGAYGPEVAASVGGKGHKPREDEDERETKEFKEQLNKWKKGGEARADKPKRYYYKTVEEVIQKGQNSNFMLPEKIRCEFSKLRLSKNKKLGNVPVIDMTGPERRVLSGYHALGSAKIVDEDLYDLDTTTGTQQSVSKPAVVGFALPELTHNLQLIVNLCEQDIIALDKMQRDASLKQANLEAEQKNLEQLVKLEKNHIDTLEKALILVQELTTNTEHLTLPRAERIFRELQQNYAVEYQEFGLGDLAASVIAPLFKIELAEWQPLQQPTLHVDLVKKWRALLDTQPEVTTSPRNIFDPYSSLIWAGIIPSFRACAASWSPKRHQLMAALLDCWAPLFPTWILDSVLEQLVLPRLSNGVREWDPLTDTVPIHQWILPWHSILGEKMSDFIYPTIREKLGAALHAWLPQDRSARAMLMPWKNSWDDANMQIFLMQHIIPKLQHVLNEFIINPLQQDLEMWNQVWEWHTLLPTLLMAQLLEKHFFPKWMQVLVMWLNQAPDFAEISRWYSGWKNMFSEELLREPTIKDTLRRALEMMHRATEVLTAPSALPTMSATPPPPPPPAPISFATIQNVAAAPAQLEFRELVSQKCAELGIIFAPLPGRRELGKQVYRVGKLYCYIDRNVCMLSDSSFKNWGPTSLAQLLERAVTGVI